MCLHIRILQFYNMIKKGRKFEQVMNTLFITYISCSSFENEC